VRSTKSVRQDRRSTIFSTTEWLWVVALAVAPLDSTLLLPVRVFGVVQLSIFRAVLVCTLGTTVFTVLTRRKMNELAGYSRSVLPLALWLCWSLLSFLWCPDRGLALRYLLATSAMVVLALAMTRLATHPERVEVLAKWVLLPVAVALLAGMIEAATGFRLPASRQCSFHNEVTSFFLNPIHFSSALALFSPFLLSRFVTPGGSLPRRLVIDATYVSLVYCVLRAGNKTGVLCLGLSLFLTMVLTVRRATLVRQAALAATIVFLILSTLQPDMLALIVPRPIAVKLAEITEVIQPEAWQGSYPSPTPEGDPATSPRVYASIASRGALIKAGIGYFFEQPIVGHGIGSPGHLLRRDDPVGVGVFSLHNWWVDLLASGGVVGFGLFAWYYIATLRRVARMASHERSTPGGYLGTSLLVSMLVGLVLPFGPASLLSFPPYWLMLGLASATATVWDSLNRAATS